MTRVVLVLSVFVLSASALTGCEAVNTLALRFDRTPPLGFACVLSGTTPPVPLFARVDEEPTFAVVTDFLDFEGAPPSCRAGALYEHCRDIGCPPLARSCVELSRDEARATGEPAAYVSSVLLERPVLTDQALPEGNVLIRTVLVRGSCDRYPLEAAFAWEDLLGCVHSCPVVLDATRDQVVLENDFAVGLCTEYHTGICAALGRPLLVPHAP